MVAAHKHICMHTQTHARMHARTHAHTHAHTHTHALTHMHTHSCRHARIGNPPQQIMCTNSHKTGALFSVRFSFHSKPCYICFILLSIHVCTLFMKLLKSGINMNLEKSIFERKHFRYNWNVRYTPAIYRLIYQQFRH